MKKLLKIFLGVLLLIVFSVLIRWASCIYSCNREYPRSECIEGMIGCPYAAYTDDCFLFCIDRDIGTVCLFPAPSWMIGL